MSVGSSAIAASFVIVLRGTLGCFPKAAFPHGPQSLGMDSCGIFYIGGSAEVKPYWRLEHLSALTAVADYHAELDVYEGNNVPGQHWSCYRSLRNSNEGTI